MLSMASVLAFVDVTVTRRQPPSLEHEASQGGSRACVSFVEQSVGTVCSRASGAVRAVEGRGTDPPYKLPQLLWANWLSQSQLSVAQPERNTLRSGLPSTAHAYVPTNFTATISTGGRGRDSNDERKQTQGGEREGRQKADKRAGKRSPFMYG